MTSRLSADGYEIAVPEPQGERPTLAAVAREGRGHRAQLYAQAFREGMQRAAEIARNPGFIQGQNTDWDEGVSHAKGFIAQAIEREANGS